MATLRSALAELFPSADATSNANMSDVVGRKTDAAVTSVGTTKSIIAYLKGILTNLNLVKGESDKIDDAAVDGIDGTSGSLAYLVEEIEIYLHSADEWYGAYLNNLYRGSTSEIIIEAGSGAYGTELIIYSGSGIGGNKYSMNKMFVYEVATVDRLVFMEFYELTDLFTKAAVTSSTTDKLTIVGHGWDNGDKVILTDLTGSSGINVNTVYYIVNKTTDDFQLSLTNGGSAVDITTANGTCDVKIISQELITETYISRLDTRPDTFIIPLGARRAASNKRMSCRAKALGGTNTVDFFVGLHTYNN